MSGSFELQFEVIRMIAASLIALAIVLNSPGCDVGPRARPHPQLLLLR